MANLPTDEVELFLRQVGASSLHEWLDTQHGTPTTALRHRIATAQLDQTGPEARFVLAHGEALLEEVGRWTGPQEEQGDQDVYIDARIGPEFTAPKRIWGPGPAWKLDVPWGYTAPDMALGAATLRVPLWRRLPTRFGALFRVLLTGAGILFDATTKRVGITR